MKTTSRWNRDAYAALRERRLDRYIEDRGVDFLMDFDWIIYALYLRHEPQAARRLVRIPLEQDSARVGSPRE